MCDIIIPLWTRPIGQAVKTLASHAGNSGSIPGWVTNNKKASQKRCLFVIEALLPNWTPRILKDPTKRAVSRTKRKAERTSSLGFWFPDGSPTTKKECKRLLLIRKLDISCRGRRPRRPVKTKIWSAENKEITPTDIKICRGSLILFDKLEFDYLFLYITSSGFSPFSS